jgi:hypothetical protein
MWRTHEMSDILLTSLTEVCHQDVMLKDQKVFLVKRLLMGIVLLWCVLCLCLKLLTGSRMSVQLPTVELQCNIPVCTITVRTSKSVMRNPRQNILNLFYWYLNECFGKSVSFGNIALNIVLIYGAISQYIWRSDNFILLWFLTGV